MIVWTVWDRTAPVTVYLASLWHEDGTLVGRRISGHTTDQPAMQPSGYIWMVWVNF